MYCLCLLIAICNSFMYYTPWVKKGCHHGYNFVNSWSICKILSLPQRAVNFQQNRMVKQRISNIWRNVNCSMLQCPTGHYRHCNWPVEKASPLSRHVCANGGHLEHLLWTNSCKQLHFLMCFWFKWLLPMVSDFYCVDAWWSIGLPCLTVKL